MSRGETFRGFMIQSRRADLGDDQNVPVGNFKEIPGTKLVCDRVSEHLSVCVLLYLLILFTVKPLLRWNFIKLVSFSDLRVRIRDFRWMGIFSPNLQQ